MDLESLKDAMKDQVYDNSFNIKEDMMNEDVPECDPAMIHGGGPVANENFCYRDLLPRPGNLGMHQGIAPGAHPPNGPIKVQLNELNSRMCDLESIAQILQEMLSPILAQVQPSTEPDTPVLSPSQSELAMDLQNISARLLVITHQLGNLTQRIEL